MSNYVFECTSCGQQCNAVYSHSICLTCGNNKFLVSPKIRNFPKIERY